MKLTGLKVLEDFCNNHADVRKQIEAWKNEVEDADWKSPLEVKGRYPSASVIDGSTIVFNIKGNDYRLLTKISFENKTVLVKEIGTHDDYDKWDL